MQDDDIVQNNIRKNIRNESVISRDIFIPLVLDIRFNSRPRILLIGEAHERGNEESGRGGCPLLRSSPSICCDTVGEPRTVFSNRSMRFRLTR